MFMITVIHILMKEQMKNWERKSECINISDCNWIMIKKRIIENDEEKWFDDDDDFEEWWRKE